VPAGTEDTKCVVKSLGNETTIRVARVENSLKATSHHFIVYRVNGGSERLEPFSCEPFADTLDPSKGAPLVVTQKSEETLALPEGVAFTLEPNQLIRLELHYINASDTEADAEASAQFITLAEEDFEFEADFLFMGNVEVDIPPRSSATLGPTYFPLPSALRQANFFGITGHEHQWGTNVQVAIADAADGEDTAVYEVENFLWNEPETVVHDPPFQVPDGGGFRFTCDWTNLSDDTVGFGESANDEMCFFWAYYYPSAGAKVCFHTEQAGGLDLCCPGEALCAFLDGF